MRDRGVITDARHGELLRRDRARRDDIRRLRNQLKTPTHPIYDPDFPDDAVDTQIAFQGLPDAEPYYFMNGEWHPFLGTRAISFRIAGYIDAIPTGTNVGIDWSQVLDDCVTFNYAFGVATNDSMVVDTDPITGNDIIVNKGHLLEVTRDVRDDADYEEFAGQNFHFRIADVSPPNKSLPIAFLTPGFYILEGGIGSIGGTSPPDPFYVDVHPNMDFDLGGNVDPLNSRRIATSDIAIAGAYGFTVSRCVATSGNIGLRVEHNAGGDISAYVSLGVTRVAPYATPFVGDDPYHA